MVHISTQIWVFPHIKFMLVFSFYLWRLYGAVYVSWISPLYYVFNNMLFTACEWSDWTYGGSFHSHLWRSMWSEVHKCKICHWKWKLDLIQWAWSKSSNFQDWEPVIKCAIYGRHYRHTFWFLEWHKATYAGKRNLGEQKQRKPFRTLYKNVNTSLKLDLASKNHCIVSL